jgi:hypothetical protein
MAFREAHGAAATEEWTDRTLDNLEFARVEGYERAIASQQLKLLQLRSEGERLVKKHGKDHPRVQKIAYDLDTLERTRAAMEFNMRVIKSQEQMEKTSWRVQGFVNGEEQKPLEAWRVELSNPKRQATTKGEKQPYLRVTHTNELGFYSFTLNEEEIKALNGEALLLQIPDNPAKGKANVLAVEVKPISGLMDLHDFSIP